MQRLISYLFIVISLGLFLNIGSQAKVVSDTLELLDNGTVRVAEPQNGAWKVNEWLKNAVLMSFKILLHLLPLLNDVQDKKIV